MKLVAYPMSKNLTAILVPVDKAVSLVVFVGFPRPAEVVRKSFDLLPKSFLNGPGVKSHRETMGKQIQFVKEKQ